ncbi:MAG TPA: hypothetical protein VF263_26170 [Longimicrobiaceae bacterium]
MSPAHRPEGYSTVSPYLILDGAGRTIEFLERVFGGVELRRFPPRTAGSSTPRSASTTRS